MSCSPPPHRVGPWTQTSSPSDVHRPDLDPSRHPRSSLSAQSAPRPHRRHRPPRPHPRPSAMTELVGIGNHNRRCIDAAASSSVVDGGMRISLCLSLVAIRYRAPPTTQARATHWLRRSPPSSWAGSTRRPSTQKRIDAVADHVHRRADEPGRGRQAADRTTEEPQRARLAQRLVEERRVEGGARPRSPSRSALGPPPAPQGRSSGRRTAPG